MSNTVTLGVLGFSVGIGIVCAVLLFIVWLVREKHPFIKYSGIFMVLFLLLLIPKVGLDNSDQCQILLANTTTQTVANVTDEVYTYSSQCMAVDTGTRTTFYTYLLYIIRFSLVYAFIMLVYAIFSRSDKLRRMMGKI